MRSGVLTVSPTPSSPPSSGVAAAEETNTAIRSRANRCKEVTPENPASSRVSKTAESATRSARLHAHKEAILPRPGGSVRVQAVGSDPA